MKNKFGSSIILAVSVLMFSSLIVFGQDEPMTIKDYYLRMPKKYDGKTRHSREEMVADAESNETLDLEHGYLRYSLRGDTVQVFEAAIFKKPGGGYILAYDEDYDSDKNPSPTKLFFLKFDQGKWTDVTAQVLSIPINKHYQYELPREGTTIEVTKDGWQKMYVLKWKNGKFVKAAK